MCAQPIVLPDFLPPIRQEPHQLPNEILNDHITITSPSLPQPYLMRQLGIHSFLEVENRYPHVAFGTRILVRRITSRTPYSNDPIYHDYITTRSVRHTIFGQWVHYSVAYPSTEQSPYSYDIDDFHQPHPPVIIRPPDDNNFYPAHPAHDNHP